MKKIKLKNGLRVLLIPQPGALAATASVLVEAGSEYEAKRVNGVSHFLEHLTFKGTVNRPKPGMIAEELAALGARSNAFTSQEYTGYWAKAETKKLPDILDVLFDLYLNPIFDPQEIEKERGVITQEMNMYEDDLPSRAWKNFMALMYGDQPAGWDVIGTKETVGRLTQKDFLAYRNERYVMPGTVVVIAGAFREADVIAQIKKYFGDIKRHVAPLKKKVAERQTGPRVSLQHKESDQGHLVLGFRAFTMFDKRRYALYVLADALGGGMSSRLYKKVRDELGAAYYVGADADLSKDHGLFGIAAGVEHAKIGLVISEALKECAKLRDELIPKKELQKTKDHIVGNMTIGLETSDDLAGFYGNQEILTGAVLPAEKIMANIRKVTAEEVRAVARDIFTNRGLNLAVVGPYKNKEAFRKILKM